MTKKRAVTYTLFAFSAFLIYSHGLCWAIDITATNYDWPGPFPPSIPIAGDDVGTGPYYSSSDAVVIDISNTTSSWTVSVRKVDSVWHNNLHLSIRKTSNGECEGNSTEYQVLDDTNRDFFSGSNACSNISVQLRLELTGTPRIISPGNYSTVVWYTVTEL
jgi:hypothetical protein